MNISGRVADAFEWVQLGLWGYHLWNGARLGRRGLRGRRILGHLCPGRSLDEDRGLRLSSNFRSAAAVPKTQRGLRALRESAAFG